MFDYFNNEKLRTKKNTDIADYNCGGWALNTFSWYCPCNEYAVKHRDEIYYDINPKNDEQYLLSPERTKICVEEMVKQFAGKIRPINNLHELKNNEYAVAFRLAPEYDDFHFCKRASNGKWSHKPGTKTIRPISKEEVFAEVWVSGFIEYTGQLVLLAVIK